MRFSGAVYSAYSAMVSLFTQHLYETGSSATNFCDSGKSECYVWFDFMSALCGCFAESNILSSFLQVCSPVRPYSGFRPSKCGHGFLRIHDAPKVSVPALLLPILYAVLVCRVFCHALLPRRRNSGGVLFPLKTITIPWASPGAT